jgi:DNA-3-methyladenine glycosylase
LASPSTSTSVSKARLPRAFFANDTRAVARNLLGACLVRVLPDGTQLSGMIVETEAYRPDDSASHSFRGRTERNAAMFLHPGTAYVYFVYGMHDCFNIVTEPAGVAAAVLVRALEPREGIEVMRANRSRAGRTVRDIDLCRGPARLCQALGIDRTFNGYDLCRRGGALFVTRGAAIPDELVRTSPRVGVSGDARAIAAEWRWFIAGNPFVSGRST